jgi:hypothetical protein
MPRVALCLLLIACDGGGSNDGGTSEDDAGRASDAGRGTDACVPRCEGACGDDGCGGSCGTCGTGLACNAGRCVAESCEAGCTSACAQGCFDLGACVATGGALDLHANVTTIGIVMTPSAAASSATVYYREQGAATWWRAVDAVALPDGRVATSAFDLVPSTTYEVRVETSTIACGTIQTLPVDPARTIDRTLYVDASASPGGNGSSGQPFRTIQEAIDVAEPGVDVHVRAGVYRESVTVSVSGAEGRHVRILGDGGAILDGRDAGTGDPTWTADGADVWYTTLAGDPRYVGRDDQRLYHYLSLADLRAGIGDDAVPMAEGFFVEGGRLYVRSNDDPGGHTFQIPARNTAIALDGVEWIWIEGLEIAWFGDGDFGKGIDVRESDHVVVRNNYVHDTPSPVWVRRGSNDVRVEGNLIHQSSVYEWPWDAVKGTDHENSAIVFEGGRGAIASGNEIHDIFNGIGSGSFDDDENPQIAYDVDVYANRFARIGDDVVEPEGACINNRFRNNTADHLLNGVSLAPITWGPVFVLRNRMTDYEESGFKVSNNSRARVWIFHNTCFTDRPDHNGMDVAGPFTNMVFRNNIVRGTRYAFEMAMAAMPNDLDYDNWFTTRGAPVIKWSDVRYDDLAAWCAATELECHGVPGDPMLEDPANGRFAITAASPNVDAAERIYGINDQYAGEGPDIGYLELGAPEVPPL